MLEHLVRYAERKGLGDDPCFVAKSVKWAIALSDDGSFRGINPLGNPDDKGWKGKQFSKTPLTPRNELQVGGKSHFLSESAETVLLLFPDEPKLNKTMEETRESIKAKHAYFRKMFEEAEKSGVKNLIPVIHFLTDSNKVDNAKQEFAGTKKAKPSDSITFDVNGTNILDMPDWHSFWRQMRSASQTENQSQVAKMPCLATGALTTPIAVHEKIKGIWGGKQTDRSLIANDKDAFQSYGLEQAYNAPVSPEAESRYRAALQELIGYAVPLGGAQFIYWTREATQADPVALVRDAEDAGFDFFGSDEKLREGGLLAALKAVRDGSYKPNGYENNQFYGCALSGNGGRVVVRDWWETSLSDVLTNVARWFDDVSIARDRNVSLKPPKFYTFLSVLVRKKQGKPQIDDLPPHIPIQLMRAALRGFPLPRNLLDKAIDRHAIEVREGDVRAERMGLIKAFLNRSGGEKMTESLNRESISIAYHCGRLLALFEQIQSKALPNVKAGVVQRFYGAASATPGLVMGRLFRTAQHHLGSIENPTYYQKLLGEVTDKIGENFPAVLSLEEQGRFALGYYHQRSERFAGNK